MIEPIIPGNLSLAEALNLEEKRLIRAALAATGGRITSTARLLKMSHQTLLYAINSRHKELQAERSPVVKRRHRLINQEPRRKYFKRGSSK